VTNLKKPVRRETPAQFRGRRLIVILEPPDLVTIKEKGRRKGYTLTVESIYVLAADAEARRQIAERRKRKPRVKRGLLT